MLTYLLADSVVDRCFVSIRYSGKPLVNIIDMRVPGSIRPSRLNIATPGRATVHGHTSYEMALLRGHLGFERHV